MGLDQERTLNIGERVYDENGAVLGQIRGIDERGFYVTAAADVSVLDGEEGGAGTDALMWRCWECGEMGKLPDIPDSCPACGAPREEIYYWQED